MPHAHACTRANNNMHIVRSSIIVGNAFFVKPFFFPIFIIFFFFYRIICPVRSNSRNLSLGDIHFYPLMPPCRSPRDSSLCVVYICTHIGTGIQYTWYSCICYYTLLPTTSVEKKKHYCWRYHWCSIILLL